MIKKIVSLLFGFSSFAQPSGAQTDTPAAANQDVWGVYERAAPDGRPLVVVARAGNSGDGASNGVDVKALLLNGRATFVICRVDPANVNDRGMPQDMAQLYSIDDALDSEPTLRAAGAMHVASVTGQGQRSMVILHPEPFDFSPLLRAIKRPSISCEASEVRDRKGLIELITPTSLEIQLNGDQDVIASLQKNGDDGRMPRKTDFWFYGQRDSLKELSANLKAHGFTMDHWLPGSKGIVLSRQMPVDLTTFRELTPIIIAAAERMRVDYDGWETLVLARTPPSGKSGKGQ